MYGRLRLHLAPIRWSLALGITAGSCLLPGSTPGLSAAELPSGATLTILVDPVQVAPLGAANFVDALPGQSLQPGDVVRTGDTGVALLTFFDGSESQLAAGSQVQIEQADYTPAPQIALFQTSGVSVNRVIPLPPGGSFRTDTPDATGLVRGTSYVVTVANDENAVGTAMTLLTDRDGHVGHLQVVPPVATTPTESLPAEAIVHLVHAGDLGAASVSSGAARPTATHLDDATLGVLELAAKNLHDAAGTRAVSDQARQTLHAVVPAPAAGTPKAPPTETDKTDEPEKGEPTLPRAAVATSTPTHADAVPQPDPTTVVARSASPTTSGSVSATSQSSNRRNRPSNGSSTSASNAAPTSAPSSAQTASGGSPPKTVAPPAPVTNAAPVATSKPDDHSNDAGQSSHHADQGSHS